MESAVKQRLTEVLKLQKVSIRTISGGNEANKMAMSRQLNGETSLTFRTISLFLEYFPTLSSEWLLRGTGSMFYDVPDDNDSDTPDYQKKIVTTLIEQLDMQKKYIQHLEETVDELKKKSNTVGGAVQTA